MYRVKLSTLQDLSLSVLSTPSGFSNGALVLNSVACLFDKTSPHRVCNFKWAYATVRMDHIRTFTIARSGLNKQFFSSSIKTSSHKLNSRACMLNIHPILFDIQPLCWCSASFLKVLSSSEQPSTKKQLPLTLFACSFHREFSVWLTFVNH